MSFKIRRLTVPEIYAGNAKFHELTVDVFNGPSGGGGEGVTVTGYASANFSSLTNLTLSTLMTSPGLAQPTLSTDPGILKLPINAVITQVDVSNNGVTIVTAGSNDYQLSNMNGIVGPGPFPGNLINSGNDYAVLNINKFRTTLAESDLGTNPTELIPVGTSQIINTYFTTGGGPVTAGEFRADITYILV